MSPEPNNNNLASMLLALALVAFPGCNVGDAGEASGAPLAGSFVAIPRASDGVARAALEQALETSPLPAGAVKPGESFYLAIAKSELEKRWFLSAYLTQLFPRNSPAANSLGTRVVSFKVQNDKLFVFDVDDRKKSSDSANPEVIVEAYPLVKGWLPFSRLPNASQYILIDPSAGLNRFGVVADAFSSTSQSESFEVDLSFTQNFRALADGVTYEQVFTGSSEAPSTHGEGIEPSAYRLSGTIGLALRRYSEGTDYKPTSMPALEHYFRSDVKLVAGAPTQTAAKWTIARGMQPIVWLISNDVLAVANHPDYAQYDVVGAIKAGIENWNAAFGFPVLEARLASAGDSPGDDDKNFLMVDSDTQFGFAFANWRTNPNTGEIRGASVYFSALWVEIGHEIFQDDVSLLSPATPTGRPPQRATLSRPQAPRLTWLPMQKQALCALHPGDSFEGAMEGTSVTTPGGPALTKKEKVERFITHVVLHEIGHTLGLRHNFKGSLKPPASSAMEYVANDDAVYGDKPGSYDVDAIRYLYGLSTQLPNDAFCTDDQTSSDPLCATFDRTADPLNLDAGPLYTNFAQSYLKGESWSPPNNSLNGVLKFLRSGGDSTTRQQAWAIAARDVLSPVDPRALASSATYGSRVDAMSRVLFRRMYLDPVASRGRFTSDPTDSAITQQVIVQLRRFLENSDAIRSFETRRMAVDILKKLQSLDAYQALVEGRAVLVVQRASLSGTDALLAEDVIRRLDAATSPYFDR